MLAACCLRNPAQLASRRLAAGSIPSSFKIAHTVLAASLTTEPDQLALDPPVAPTRILARKPRHQLPDLHPGRPPAGTPVRIPPAACHQLADNNARSACVNCGRATTARTRGAGGAAEGSRPRSPA